MASAGPVHGDDDGRRDEQTLALTGGVVRAEDAPGSSPRQAVLVVDGEIDVATGTRLRAKLAACIAEPEVEVVVADVTAVTFMSSTGIAVLVDAHAEAEQAGKSLRLIAGQNRAVLNPLRITGVDALLHLEVGTDPGPSTG